MSDVSPVLHIHPNKKESNKKNSVVDKQNNKPWGKKSMPGVVIGSFEIWVSLLFWENYI